VFPLPPEQSPAWLVLSWLASWRLAALLTYDHGPFELLTRARARLARAGLHRLLACFHCTVLWVSLAVVGITFERRWISLIVALAVAGAASITERFLGGASETIADGSRD